MAINPASINSVPDPHIGSIKSWFLSQLLSNTMPAARTSFIGAENNLDL